MKRNCLFALISALLVLSGCACPTETTPPTTPPTTTTTPPVTTPPVVEEPPPPPPPTTTTTTTTTPSPSDVTNNPSAYDGKTVELSGQTYLTGSPPRLLLDGKSGVNIAGNTATLQKGFYRLTGVYNADTNTLNLTESIKE